jgi:chaperone BCS1
VVLTGARQALVFGSIALRRRMLVSLEINNKDKAYDWFLAWMANQTATAAASPESKSLLRSAPWIKSHQLSVETRFEERKNGSSSVLFNLVAGPGTHWFKYQGAWMQVRRVLCTYDASDVWGTYRSKGNARRGLCS